MIDSLRFARFLKELSVPVVMTGHWVYSDIVEYIILTITALLRDESLPQYCFVATAFGPQGCPIYSAALVSSLPVRHPSNPISVCDSPLSTAG